MCVSSFYISCTRKIGTRLYRIRFIDITLEENVTIAINRACRFPLNKISIGYLFIKFIWWTLTFFFNWNFNNFWTARKWALTWLSVTRLSDIYKWWILFHCSFLLILPSKYILNPFISLQAHWAYFGSGSSPFL